MIYGKTAPSGEIKLKDIKVLKSEGRTIVNPSRELMLTLGYKPLVSIEPNKSYSGPLYPRLIEEDKRILRIYENERGERV